jgi:hypothetical protein
LREGIRALLAENELPTDEFLVKVN